MEETGLQRGAADLREQQLFLDFTLKVQSQEFQVHKFVLVAVSDYFRAMLSGSMSESSSDTVELKELNPEHVSKLIDFIYTGRSYYVNSKPKEILELAVYFQMPTIIQKCRRNLFGTLLVRTCVDLLSTFITYSMDQEVEKVRSFIKSHTAEVIQHYKVEDITPDVVVIILDNWTKSEWEMYKFLQSWIHADFEDRQGYLNEFMNHIRFSIMTPEQIKEIMEKDEFVEAEGSWKELVDKAAVYHEQTILQKVADDSKQSKSRFDKCAFVLSIGADKEGKTKCRVLVKGKDKTSNWKMCKAIDTPQVTGKISYVLEANNFLITFSEFGENQTWQIFDPLTLSWMKMPNMTMPKDGFAMVYHDKHLYVLGGRAETQGTRSTKSEICLTDTVDKYSFAANKWSSTKTLPVAVMNHGACVLNGDLFVSGGMVVKGQGIEKSARMDCLDIASQKWEGKAPMHKETVNHEMHVMTINKQESIVVIDCDLKVRYYNPVSDQWSSCDTSLYAIEMELCNDILDHPYKDVRDLTWGSESMMLVDGNVVYLFNLHGEEPIENDPWYACDSDQESSYSSSDLCVKWRVDEKEPAHWYHTGPRSDKSEKIIVLQFATEDFPVPAQYWSKVPPNIIGGVLAFSPDIFQ